MTRPRCVFVVDDSEIVLGLTAAALEDAGYEARTMTSWEDLERVLSVARPDLILMDVNMPLVTGDYALPFFKEERGLQAVPILLYSDINPVELERRARDCGADGFVPKGAGLDGMLAAIAQHLPRG